jgi:AhpD family alkylhydroperoxidase
MLSMKGTAMSALPSKIPYETFRLSFPQVHAALLALGADVDGQGLEKDLSELVKLRVSQINGCAFCLQLHLTMARAIGLDASKIDLLPTWREAGIYSKREQAALAWAERLTIFPGSERVSEGAWQDLRRHFDEREAGLLTVAIATINSWNRVALGMGFPLPTSAVSA